MQKYIFVFLGEFGYELLNWQAVVKKFSTTINSEKEKIICCSRANLYQLYEGSDYIDISELPLFKKSVACMYFGLDPAYRENLRHKKNRQFQKKLISQIKNYALKKLYQKREISFFSYAIYKIFGLNPRCCKFIFSCNHEVLNGIDFGLDLKHSQSDLERVDIYSKNIIPHNSFAKILPNFEVKKEIEKSLGFALDENYILCQTGNRQIITRSADIIDKEAIILDLAKDQKVILLSFNSGRNLDSGSTFEKIYDNVYEYKCREFKEQSCLIYFSKFCVFFTEGDFRSHNYVPPFLGKNVISIAPKSVFALGNAPIDFWNREIFKFGGKIIAVESEELQKDHRAIKNYLSQAL